MDTNPNAWTSERGAEICFPPEQLEMPFERDVLPPILTLEELLAKLKRDYGDTEQFQAIRAALRK